MTPAIGRGPDACSSVNRSAVAMLREFVRPKTRSHGPRTFCPADQSERTLDVREIPAQRAVLRM
jgi:hypothetical protein